MAIPGGVDEWDALARGDAAGLVAAAAALPDAPAPAEIARLRALGPPALVAAALELARARRRAAARLDDAARLLADVEGVEQASGTRVARHKAARFRAAGVDRVVDLCCGIGGDAIELARALGPARVLAVDLDPRRARMAAHNAGCAVTVADAAAVAPDGAAFHVDPARRVEGGGRRLRRLADYRPGPAVLEALCASGAPGALKLGPGVALEDVPERGDRELEIVGDRGGLVQAVLWCGALATAPGHRTATRLESGATFGAEPRPIARRGPLAEFVHVPDPALERAGLVGARAPDDAVEIAPGLGLLTSAAPLRDPWFRSFEVLAAVPWRERKLRDALAAHDAGLVRVKVRGGVADANAAERALRGDGSAELWVLAFRDAARAVGVVAREVGAAERGGDLSDRRRPPSA